MPLSDNINHLPTWPKRSYNKWADYIELSCLKSQDIVSIDDILDHYLDERAEESDRGSWEHSAKYDRILSDVENYFHLIEFRSEALQVGYPFETENRGSITLKPEFNNEHLFYLFLLFASNLSFFEGSTRYTLTHAFEDLSCTILHAISPSMSNTQIFGTARTETEDMEFRGNLRTRLSLLADRISAVTTKPFDTDPKYNVPAGDGGLDLVSYLTFDHMPFVPVSFAQCACSYEEWAEKQNSITYEKWSKRFSNMAPYLQFMFVPFYCRCANGEFENPTDISTCLIDRHRIFRIAEMDPSIVNVFCHHPIYSVISNIIR